jgi:hypothetical protein
VAEVAEREKHHPNLHLTNFRFVQFSKTFFVCLDLFCKGKIQVYGSPEKKTPLEKLSFEDV